MKHLDLETREKIETGLKEKKNFSEIANITGYHRTSISDEVIKHRIKARTNNFNNNFSNCAYEDTCSKYNGVSCKQKCEKYIRKECISTKKAPYVCNGCSKKSSCQYQKYYYRAKEAHEQYLTDLKDSRIGINIPAEVIDEINEVIAPLIKEKGQTVNQVYINHPDLLYFSKSEFYKLVNEGYLNITNLDLPRKVKYSKRKSKVRRTREESLIRIGRTYEDYKKFVKENNIENVVQLDTVEGEKGGKVLLTITFTKYELMLMYLLDAQTSDNVSKVFDWLKQTLGEEFYCKLFYCILTDNGKEFFQPDKMENINKVKKCSVFYCDPGASWQKGCCEVNHHYIRYPFPKKESTFDNLTQEDCNYLMSNIANIPREKLNNKTPYETITEILSEEELLKLGIKKVPKDEVDLTASHYKGRDKRNKK